MVQAIGVRFQHWLHHRFSGPRSLLSNRYREPFPLGQSDKRLKNSSHFLSSAVSKNSRCSTALAVKPYDFMEWCFINHMNPEIILSNSVKFSYYLTENSFSIADHSVNNVRGNSLCIYSGAFEGYGNTRIYSV
jgi:hypothetical protein